MFDEAGPSGFEPESQVPETCILSMLYHGPVGRGLDFWSQAVCGHLQSGLLGHGE